MTFQVVEFFRVSPKCHGELGEHNWEVGTDDTHSLLKAQFPRHVFIANIDASNEQLDMIHC